MRSLWSSLGRSDYFTEISNIKCTQCDHPPTGNTADAVLCSLIESLTTLDTSSSTPATPKSLPNSYVPHCPSRPTGVLHLAIIWFTEPLSPATLSFIHSWVRSATIIDAMPVKGTSAEVYRETAYIEAAQQKGARIAVVDVEKDDPALLGFGKQDWYFEGYAADIAPKILGPAIGSVGETQENH